MSSPDTKEVNTVRWLSSPLLPVRPRLTNPPTQDDDRKTPDAECWEGSDFVCLTHEPLEKCVFSAPCIAV